MANKDIPIITNIIYQNFPYISNLFPRWALLSLIDRNQDKLVYVKDGEMIRGVAMFLRLTDETLSDLIMNNKDILDKESLNEMLKEKGENIHFLFVCADSVGVILKGLRNVMKNEKINSISWFNVDMKFRFIKYRRELCHQSQ